MKKATRGKHRKEKKKTNTSIPDLRLFIVVSFSPVVGHYCFCSEEEEEEEEEEEAEKGKTFSAYRVASVDSACTSPRQLQRRFIMIKRQPTSPSR